MAASRIANINQGGDRQTAHLQFETTRAKAADLLKVYERTVNMAKKVVSEGDESLINAVEAGRVSVSEVAKTSLTH